MRRHHNVRILNKSIQYLLFSLMALLIAVGSAEAGSITQCDDCHGMPPIDFAYRNITTGAFVGTHNTHNPLGTAANCSVCHGAAVTSYGTSHRDGTINMASKLNNHSAAAVGRARYNKPIFFNQTSKPVMTTCSTVNCHFETTTPAWGSSPIGAASVANCGFCHNALPTTNAHTSHITAYGNNLTACPSCHNNNFTSPTPYLHAHDAGSPLFITPGHGYTGSNNNYLPSQSGSRVVGSCSTASCHANVYAAGMISSPLWSATVGCSACHKDGGAFVSNGAPNTGSHAAHTAPAVGALCGQCHAGAISGSSGGSSHSNGSVDVTNDYFGAPVAKHTAGTYSGYCASASCHASPYAATAVNSPVWGATTGCASCHNESAGIGGSFQGNGAPATGSHAKHMTVNNAACNMCHAGAVSGVSGGSTHANTTVEVSNGYSASPVTKHPIGTYAGTCSAASCHSDGNGTPVASPKWGLVQAYSCGSCHGGPATVTSAGVATGKHRSHMNNYSTLGRDNNLMCAECHAKTVSLGSNTAITNPVNHINSLKDYSGVKAGKMQTAFSQNTCASNYCHSSGQATPVFRNMTGSKLWSGAAKFGCNGCHGNEPGATWSSSFGAPNYDNKYDATLATANSHQKHTVSAGMTDSRGCIKCHDKTVDGSIPDKMRDYSTAHLNKVRDVSYGYTFSGYSNNYRVLTKTCNNYCHSNVQAPGLLGGPPTFYGKPAWGSNGTIDCGSCHARMASLTETPADLELGTHKRHAVDAGYTCSICHGPGYSPTTTGATHTDSTINISFSGKAANTTYSQSVDNIPGEGYGTCSTSNCHGRATRNWGLNTTDPTCEKCHGSANTAQTTGVFKDTGGSPASAYVGTHVSHLAGTHNYSAPITCNQCHVVPASINSFGHMTSLPARINWGSLSNHSSVIRGGGAKFAMSPTYTGAPARQCTNTYCHAGVQDFSAGTYTPQGSAPSPVWGDPAYLGGTGCGKCHGNPPGGVHSPSTNCNACHNHIAASNISFNDKTKHINGIVETTVDECLGCHSSVTACLETDPACINKKLIGAHIKHTDADIFLVGKKLSTGDYIDPSWIYSIQYKKGFPKFACGFCHPMNQGTHKNSIVELDLDPSHSLAGTVKTKNDAAGPWVTEYTYGANVKCNNVYCHSNGYISDVTKKYAYRETPNWYATNPWGAVDKCGQCHGNSPDTGGITGSTAHAKHVVGNHYKGVFSGYSGKFAVAGTVGSGAVHGDPNTSTTFNCNLCHNDTVKVAYNDKNNICATCHTSSGSAPLVGTLGVYSSNTVHVNGDVDITFPEPFILKSKAQLRNSISSVQSVYTSWTRVKGYKTYSSYDLARTKPVYNLGTCSTTACHNNTQMEWRTQGPLACAACHTGLPQ